jgi:ATP-dependent DNA helicase RecQ
MDAQLSPGLLQALPDGADAEPASVHAGAPSAALAVLREVFGYPHFRGQQAAVVQRLCSGGEALVLMPTGAGKSLCYQVPAIVRHRAGKGVAIVVSPLIALMHDQVGALEEAGVHAAFLNSSQEGDEARRVERELLSGRLVLLYAAPERILSPRFLAMLDSLHERAALSLFAIDEAHCVSQWGHDFREEYLGLAQLHERYPSVPRIALTATADAHTRADIIDKLGLTDAQAFVSSFDRPNIRYTIIEKANPKAQLLHFVQTEHAGDSGIVYCQSRKRVEETAAWLQQQGLRALPYHAGMDAEQRRQHQDRFLREDGVVVVATIAFGMGIDKPDVRFVAHLDLPKNIEGYSQETGRAGRDGLPANAWMTYGLADVVNQRRMIDDSEAGEDFKQVQRGKLDALLALCEGTDCRRARLLRYFGQAPPQAGTGAAAQSDGAAGVDGTGSDDASSRYRCFNCDNCLHAPEVQDATEDARKLLSCVYRFAQSGGGFGPRSFGAGHLIDVLRGKRTEKVTQYGHEQLSTFGIGAAREEAHWRAVLRQLIALGHLRTEGEWNTLALTESSRAVLRGEVQVAVRAPAAPQPKARRERSTGSGAGNARDAAGKGGRAAAIPLDESQQQRFEALRAWRAEVAKAHNLPAYIVFHDATLAQMARDAPQTLAALAQVQGVGARKLEAYGEELLRVLGAGGEAEREGR